MTRVPSSKGLHKAANPRRLPENPDGISEVQRMRIACAFDSENSEECAPIRQAPNMENFSRQESLLDAHDSLLQNRLNHCTRVASENSMRSYGMFEDPVQDPTLIYGRDVLPAGMRGTSGAEPAIRMPPARDFLEDVEAEEEEIEFEGTETQYETITVGEREAITCFFDDRLRRIGQICLKKILKAWIRVIHPQKQAKFPYNGGKTKDKAILQLGPSHKGDLTKPRWWPSNLRHCEPDHQSKQERLYLATHILRYPEWNSEILRTSTREIASSLEDRFKESVPLSLAQIYDIREKEERYERDEISGDVECPILVSDAKERKPRAALKRPIKPEKSLLVRDKQPGHSARKRRGLPKSPTPGLSSTSMSSDISYRDLRQSLPEEDSPSILGYGNIGANTDYPARPLNAGYTQQPFHPTGSIVEVNQAYGHQMLMSQGSGTGAVYGSHTTDFNAPSAFPGLPFGLAEAPIMSAQDVYRIDQPLRHQLPLSSSNSVLRQDRGIQTTDAQYGPAAGICSHGFNRGWQQLCVRCQNYSAAPNTPTGHSSYSSMSLSDDSSWEMVGLEHATNQQTQIADLNSPMADIETEAGDYR